MQLKSTKAILVTSAALVLLAVIVMGSLIWLAWGDYLFPQRYREYYPNGKISFDGYKIRVAPDMHVNDGHWIIYNNDGSKDHEGSYRRGREVGTWTTYYPDGTPQEIMEYDDNGISQRCTKFAKDGTKKVIDRATLPPFSGEDTGIIWSRDPKKCEACEKAYWDKHRAGMDHNEAREATIQEYHLRDHSPAKASDQSTTQVAPK